MTKKRDYARKCNKQISEKKYKKKKITRKDFRILISDDDNELHYYYYKEGKNESKVSWKWRLETN